MEAESRDEEENARQEEDNLMVENQEEQIPDTARREHPYVYRGNGSR